jgi:hypothetical protein
MLNSIAIPLRSIFISLHLYSLQNSYHGNANQAPCRKQGADLHNNIHRKYIIRSAACLQKKRKKHKKLKDFGEETPHLGSFFLC